MKYTVLGLSINLEEQLALVQKQLQALAQLPSTIQETLNTVTQQLSELVLAQHSQAEVSFFNCSGCNYVNTYKNCVTCVVIMRLLVLMDILLSVNPGSNSYFTYFRIQSHLTFRCYEYYRTGLI